MEKKHVRLNVFLLHFFVVQLFVVIIPNLLKNINYIVKLFQTQGGTMQAHLHGPGPGDPRSPPIGQQHDRRRLAPPPELPPRSGLPGRTLGQRHHANRECARGLPRVANDRRAPQVISLLPSLL